MLIPEPFLSKLSRLLSAGESTEFSPPLLQVSAFQIREHEWACLIAAPTTETWFFQPFQSNAVDSERLSRLNGGHSPQWNLNEAFTARVQKSIATFCAQSQIEDLSDRFFVIRNESAEDVLAANCIHMNLVAATLQSWGNPPEAVQQDWANQLASLTRSYRPCTAETLVTREGILVAWLSIISNLEPFDLKHNHFVLPQDSMPAPDWPMPFKSQEPVLGSKSSMTFEISENSESRESASFDWAPQGSSIISPIRPKSLEKNKRSKWLPIAGSIATVALGSLALWFTTPETKLIASKAIDRKTVDRTTNEATTNEGNAVDPKTGNTPEVAAAEGEAKQTEPELTQMLTESDNAELSPDTNPPPSELTTETLLAQLSSTKDQSFNLNSMTTSSVISEVLTPTGHSEPAQGFNSDNTTDESEAMDTPDSVALATVESEPGAITLERPLRIQAAVIKESVSIGKPVLPKACRCEIELKLAGKKIVVEPSEVVSIEGAGSSRWKVGIEDEEPELIVEISSKPGSKWQFVTKVGLLESAKAIPVLIGPRDAQNVGNRLIQFQEMINASVEELRSAKANSRGRSPIDYAVEIKRLEQMGREAKKALEHWKVIARLCHLFFDSNEVRFQFIAIEKT